MNIVFLNISSQMHKPIQPSIPSVVVNYFSNILPKNERLKIDLLLLITVDLQPSMWIADDQSFLSISLAPRGGVLISHPHYQIRLMTNAHVPHALSLFHTLTHHSQTACLLCLYSTSISLSFRCCLVFQCVLLQMQQRLSVSNICSVFYSTLFLPLPPLFPLFLFPPCSLYIVISPSPSQLLYCITTQTLHSTQILHRYQHE